MPPSGDEKVKMAIFHCQLRVLQDCLKVLEIAFIKMDAYVCCSLGAHASPESRRIKNL